jgi:hypothetical protein
VQKDLEEMEMVETESEDEVQTYPILNDRRYQAQVRESRFVGPRTRQQRGRLPGQLDPVSGRRRLFRSGF